MCYSPPLLAGFRCRWWCAVPRHSWLGSAVGGVRGVWCAAVVCWWGCGWYVVWLVPRHSWRRFLCATPRHSRLGFAAGGGGRSSPLLAEGPGRGSPPLLAGVRWRRWCAVGLWLVCGVVGPLPLLAEVPVCYSPPLLAGFRCRWWCVVPRHSWLGSAGGGGVRCVVCGVWCVVCGVRRWCAGGVVAGVWCRRSLATPGGGSCVLLPATPGWVSLPVVVRVPRHSWRRVQGAVPRHSWLGFAVGGGVWCVVCGVWCVVCGGGVCGGVVAGVWCGWSLATPGGGSCVLLPSTPGWVSLPVVVFSSLPLLAGARRLWWCVSRAGVFFVVCVCGVCGCALWPCCVVRRVFVVSVFLMVWCGGAVGVSSGCPSPWSWCVCVRCVALRVGVGRVAGGRARCGCRACPCVCLWCVIGWVGCVIPWLVLVLRRRHGSKSRRRGPCCVHLYILLSVAAYMCAGIPLALLVPLGACGTCVLWLWCALWWRVVPCFWLHTGVPHTMLPSSVRRA